MVFLATVGGAAHFAAALFMECFEFFKLFRGKESTHLLSGLGALYG
jgi:hypothetical protein